VFALIWNISFPINKSLWTSPFVLITSGAGIAVLLSLVFLEKTPLKGALNIFTPFGKNPLFIYVLAFMWETMMYTFTIGNQTWYDWFYQQLCRFLDLYNASLLFALIHVFLFWCVAKFMEKKNITISL
jgi:predicted acyltransferase